MNKISSRPYVRQIIEEYFEEVEFEEFLQDTANLVMHMEEEIKELKEKIKKLEDDNKD